MEGNNMYPNQFRTVQQRECFGKHLFGSGEMDFPRSKEWYTSQFVMKVSLKLIAYKYEVSDNF